MSTKEDIIRLLNIVAGLNTGGAFRTKYVGNAIAR
jgi:hypothetical protein